MKTVTLDADTIVCKCTRCGYTWISRKIVATGIKGGPIVVPKNCSKCRSPYWRLPRRLVNQQNKKLKALQEQIRAKKSADEEII